MKKEKESLCSRCEEQEDGYGIYGELCADCEHEMKLIKAKERNN